MPGVLSGSTFCNDDNRDREHFQTAILALYDRSLYINYLRILAIKFVNLNIFTLSRKGRNHRIQDEQMNTMLNSRREGSDQSGQGIYTP